MAATITKLSSLEISDGLVANLINRDSRLETVEGALEYLAEHGTLAGGTVTPDAARFVEDTLRQHGYKWNGQAEAAHDESAAGNQADADEAADPHAWIDWQLSELTNDQAIIKHCTDQSLETLGAAWEYLCSLYRTRLTEEFERFWESHPDQQQVKHENGGCAEKYEDMVAVPRKVYERMQRREKHWMRAKKLGRRVNELKVSWIVNTGPDQLTLPGVEEVEEDEKADASDETDRATTETKCVADETADESWRLETLASLGLPKKLLEKLAENDPPLQTVGDVSDWIDADKRLTDIKGVGQAKAELIEQALEEFWKRQHSVS